MTRPTCKDCRYWYGGDDVMVETTDDLKQCRRQVPTYLADARHIDEGDLFGHWPVTFGDNWCGEHKPIETENEAFTLDETSEARKVMADAIGLTGNSWPYDR